MCYPETTFMTRTFELTKKRLDLNMLPYYRDNDSTISYNNTSITKVEKKKKDLMNEDIFKISVANDGYFPKDFFKQGTGVVQNKILGDLRQRFVDNPFPVAFEKLKKLEDHSVTSYLLLGKKIPYPVVK